MYFIDRTAVVVKPTAKFLDWLKIVEGDDMPEVTVEQLRTNCSVFLIPETEEPEDAVAYLDEHYRKIFETELSGWLAGPEDWPQDMSLKAFWEFFDIEIHDTVLDMEEAQLDASPVFDNMR